MGISMAGQVPIPLIIGDDYDDVGLLFFVGHTTAQQYPQPYR